MHSISILKKAFSVSQPEAFNQVLGSENFI